MCLLEGVSKHAVGTHSLRIGGATALVEPCVNTVAYHFHEKVWKRLVNRKRGRDGSDGGALAV